MSYILSCESTVDLPYEYVSSRNIPVLFYKYSVNGTDYEDVMERSDEKLSEFYGFIDAGNIPTTSQINQFTYEEFFDSLLSKGEDVIHICFGTGMTGSYNNAVNAKEEMEEKYPDRKLIVIDSLCSSGGYGMLVDNAADKRDEGLSIEELEKWCYDNRTHLQHYFTNPDLSYFKRTGRLSGPTATIASVLNIVPVMRLDKDGKMFSYDKYRGKKKAYQHFIDEMLRLADNGADYDGKLFVYHARCPEDAELLRGMLTAAFPKATLRMGQIGTIIVSHCGPGTIAFFFTGKERE